MNGPCAEQSGPAYRGMSIFACDPAEAARLSDGDPSVAAGRLTQAQANDLLNGLRDRITSRVNSRAPAGPPPDGFRHFWRPAA